MTWRGAALAALALSNASCAPAAPTNGGKVDLYLISSLPLMFGEDFDLAFKPAPVMEAVADRYRVRAIDRPSQLTPGALLLMAQPRSLPPAELVALDDWVRRGGHLVLLADPLLEWPSKRPLGDRLRPPLSFADTGLLAHWGLRLDGPGGVGPLPDERAMATPSAGRLVRVADGCAVGIVTASCRLGRGMAVVVADADWLGPEPPSTAAAAGALDRLLRQARGLGRP